MKKITINIVFIMIVISLMIVGNCLTIKASGTNDCSKESAQRYMPTINDNFDDDSIIVIINKDYSSPNKLFSKSFFKTNGIESVIDLTEFSVDKMKSNMSYEENFMQILKLKMSFNDKEKVLSTIKEIEQIEGVYAAEPNYYGCGGALPINYSGNRYPQLWGLHDQNFGIKSEEAWNYSIGDASIRVAVIDTGIFPHTNLSGNLTTGYNFVDNNTNTNDTDGHGTHIAGIIGATQNIENGIVGVNWNITLVPLKISNTVLNWATDRVVQAITWAKNNDVPIINFSGCNFGECALKTAISNYDGLFVTIAGNGSSNNDVNYNYPSNYSTGQIWSDRVISVGAMNDTGNITSLSNWGANSVSIFAPGENILSTVPTTVSASGYAYYEGTSMAAPFVTGVAALMLSVDNSLTPQQIKATIMNNATRHSEFTNLCVCGGILDAYKAVASVALSASSVNDGISINGFNNVYTPTNNMELTLPNSLALLSSNYGTQQQPIIQIGDNAFENYTSISSVTLPSGLEIIGGSAFKGCTSLNNVIVPYSVKTIGNNAFKFCSSLGSVSLERYKDPLTTIGSATFTGCGSLSQIIVPKIRLDDYRNESNWSTYQSLIIEDVNSYPSYNVYSYSNFDLVSTLSPGCTKLYQLNVNSQEVYCFTSSAGSTIELYDNGLELIGTNSELLALLLPIGIYYVSVQFNNPLQAGTITTSISKHTHNYTDHYQWKSTTEHKSYCLCGSYITDFHVVSPDAYQNGNQFAICLLCHGIASFGGIIHNGIGNFPYTLNGSFILPNGVIVLDNDDMEAYLNGTLIFINPNENVGRRIRFIPSLIRREENCWKEACSK